MLAWEVEPNKNAKPMIGIPLHPSFPYLHVAVFSSILNALRAFPGTPLVVSRQFEVSVAREEIAKSFLNSDCTHLLMLDSDIVMKPDTLPRMIAVDAPLVVAKYAEKGKTEASYHCYHHSQVPFRRDPPVEVRPGEHRQLKDIDPMLFGLGCVLIKREVFEKLEEPYFKFTISDEQEDDYWRVSEDFYFALKCHHAGIRPKFCDDIEVLHLATVGIKPGKLEGVEWV